jgi:hypothetical protein
MNGHIINLNSCSYSIKITQNNEDNLILIILDPADYFGAVIQFEPCGEGRYNYEILLNKGMDETTIDELLELFNEQILEEE